MKRLVIVLFLLFSVSLSAQLGGRRPRVPIVIPNVVVYEQGREMEAGRQLNSVPKWAGITISGNRIVTEFVRPEVVARGLVAAWTYNGNTTGDVIRTTRKTARLKPVKADPERGLMLWEAAVPDNIHYPTLGDDPLGGEKMHWHRNPLKELDPFQDYGIFPTDLQAGLPAGAAVFNKNNEMAGIVGRPEGSDRTEFVTISAVKRMLE